MNVSKNLLTPTALLFASIALVGGSNDAYGIVHGNALLFSSGGFVGEDLTNGQGTDLNFDYNNPDPTAFERTWHDQSSWGLQTDHADGGADCSDPELGTCGGGVTMPGIPTNYNPDYGNLLLNLELQRNLDFDPTPIDPNDPFDPLASDAFNNANALGPNPAKMLRTKTDNGSPGSGFTTFSTDDPFTAQRAQVNGRKAAVAGDLDTTQILTVVITHDIFLPVDVNNPVDNGGRQDGIRVGDDNTLAVVQLDLRAGDVSMEGRMLVGNGAVDSRNTFNMTGGSLSIGAAAESTLNIQGGPLNNFRDANLEIGTGGGGNAPAVFNHMAGDVNISGAIDMTSTGGTRGAIGTYNMSPGTTLTLHRLGGDETAHIYLGDGTDAVATFNQNGGTATVDAGIHLGRHPGVLSPVLPQLNTPQGLGIYNLVGGAASAAGDFDGDGDVDGADFLSWQRGESPNGAGSADLATWTTDYGTAGGGGGVTTLIQGTSTTFDFDTGESQKDAIIVGNAGIGQLNIDSSSGDVVLDGNAILVAALDTTQGPSPSGVAPSAGLVNIIGENATITIGDLSVGDGVATFRFEADAGVSPINVEAGHGDPLNLGDVDIDGATLDVDLSNLDAGAGDLLLIGVGGTLTGEFAGLAQNAAVTAGYTISYTFGDGNDIGLVAPGGITAVPEPASMLLCLLATLGAACTRKR